MPGMGSLIYIRDPVMCHPHDYQATYKEVDLITNAFKFKLYTYIPPWQ